MIALEKIQKDSHKNSFAPHEQRIEDVHVTIPVRQWDQNREHRCPSDDEHDEHENHMSQQREISPADFRLGPMVRMLGVCRGRIGHLRLHAACRRANVKEYAQIQPGVDHHRQSSGEHVRVDSEPRRLRTILERAERLLRHTAKNGRSALTTSLQPTGGLRSKNGKERSATTSHPPAMHRKTHRLVLKNGFA